MFSLIANYITDSLADVSLALKPPFSKTTSMKKLKGINVLECLKDFGTISL
jgi:hypothetical protein